MTALRFQTGERHQASPASLRGAQGGEEEEKKKVFGEWRGLVAVGRDVGRGGQREVEGGLLWVWCDDTPSTHPRGGRKFLGHYIFIRYFSNEHH